MSKKQFIIGLLVCLLSLFPYPYGGIGACIALIYCVFWTRWNVVSLAQLAKTAKDDNEKIIESLNGTIRMLNDHTALLKRLKFMDNDIDGLEKETKNIKSDLKKIRMEKK